MMPRIQAQELLDKVRANGLGFGSYDRKDATAMLRELREKAFGHRVKVRKASAPVLAMMGIGMAQVPAQPLRRAHDERGRTDG